MKREKKESKKEEEESFCVKQKDVRVAYSCNQPLLELEYKKIYFSTNDVNFSLSNVDYFSQKFKDDFAKDVPSGLPTTKIIDHQFDFILNSPKDQIDYS